MFTNLRACLYPSDRLDDVPHVDEVIGGYVAVVGHWLSPVHSPHASNVLLGIHIVDLRSRS